VALRGRAPYTTQRRTAGWTLDEQGRAMSKSLGNGVDPVDIATEDGRRDRAAVGGIHRLPRRHGGQRKPDAALRDIYRKLRNTFRFLLGNLHGFDPARDAGAEADLEPLDRTCWPGRASLRASCSLV
jgi:isoleucyl-tRNA synthetase